MALKKINFLAIGCLLFAQTAMAHGPQPLPLQRVPIPPVPGLTDGGNPIVVNKDAAIALGKALFWDVNVGSDGMACGSCHFHAGADARVSNQLNPGLKSSNPSGQKFSALFSGPYSGGANYTLKASDFPLHSYINPLSQTSGVKSTTDDVVASSGTFSGEFTATSKFTGTNDQCGHADDPLFHVDQVRTRRVEPRNAPTVINAIFNHRNFWDGRANNVYNGSSPWGERDPNAGVWVKAGFNAVEKQRLSLINSSLASLAMGPPLSDTEMACRQRAWPDIGRKLLLRKPLQNQKVHNEDSVLAAYSMSTSGNLMPGLNTTYTGLIRKAFNSKYWSYIGTGNGKFGQPASGPAYNQMEANFSMFFGLALQLYQSTLVSDQAPIDLTTRTEENIPQWDNLGYSAEKIAQLQKGHNAFINNHCQICHAGPTTTLAAIATNSMLVTPTPGATYGPDFHPITYGPAGIGAPIGGHDAGVEIHGNVITRDQTRNGATIFYKLMDLGFVNTGVANPDSDPGIDSVDDFGNPLSFSKQYLEYLLDNPAPNAIVDSIVHTQWACDFIKPLAIADNNQISDFWFGLPGLIDDGAKENALRNSECNYSPTAYLPSAEAAQAALGTVKMAVATKAAFKVPTLRNIELTGPYMHNGSMATLSQVVEFYARKGNFNNDNLKDEVSQIQLGGPTTNKRLEREALVEFLKTFTDDRVRYEKAPFDHPEIIIPHGHVGDNQLVEGGNPIDVNLAKDALMTVPAVGANGRSVPLLPFDAGLAP